ncbi:hypothetical protein [Azospirillum thermophilum]|nr:hypothetical protein [Azospirillum thermophilum]
MQGVAIKLRYCVAALDGGPVVEAAVLEGAPLPPTSPATTGCGPCGG